MPGFGDAFLVGLIVLMALLATRLGRAGDALGAIGRAISGKRPPTADAPNADPGGSSESS